MEAQVPLGNIRRKLGTTAVLVLAGAVVVAGGLALGVGPSAAAHQTCQLAWNISHGGYKALLSHLSWPDLTPPLPRRCRPQQPGLVVAQCGQLDKQQRYG